MWSRAFDMEMKYLFIKGHIRDKKDVERFKIREFSKDWEEQLVRYDVIYDSSGKFVEPACYIILSEHQGVMGSHNAILSMRQESEKRQGYGSNQPLDLPFLPGEPYSFRFPNDDIARILLALNSECLNSQQHNMIEEIQSMFKPNWCCHAHTCYDKVRNETMRLIIIQRQSMEGYTGRWRVAFCLEGLEHQILNWYEQLIDKNGSTVPVEVDRLNST
jgi:hypothetical protein